MRSATTFLLAFALVAFGAAPLRAGDAPKKPARSSIDLRVATFNVWLIPLFSKDLKGRLVKLPASLRPLSLDVLCLQEAWIPADQEQIRTALEKSFPHAVLSKGGLMVLSRYPVVTSRFVKFPVFKGLSMGERLANKGLLDVVLETPCGPLRIITSHLALSRGPDNPRTKQLAFLLDHLDARREMPLVVAADLNTWPVEKGRLTADYREVLRSGLIDAKPPLKRPDGRWHPGKPTRLGWPRTENNDRGWYPDHILFRTGRSARLVLRGFAMALDTRETAISDHNLLYADFTLTPATPQKPSKKPREKPDAKR